MTNLNKPKYSSLEIARVLNEVVNWGDDAGEMMAKLPGVDEEEIETAFTIANLEFEIQSQKLTIERWKKQVAHWKESHDECNETLLWTETERFQLEGRLQQAHDKYEVVMAAWGTMSDWVKDREGTEQSADDAAMLIERAYQEHMKGGAI